MFGKELYCNTNEETANKKKSKKKRDYNTSPLVRNIRPQEWIYNK